MLRIVLRPREQVEKAWREWDRERLRSRQEHAKPSVVMADEAAALLDRREFVFRGRPYRVPPVPASEGARLLALQDHLRRIDRYADPIAVLGPLRIALAICKRICYPRGAVRRALWRITPNPFLKATPREVGELLGFFSACLVMDQARRGTTTASRGISSRTSLGSRGSSPRGPIRPGGRRNGEAFRSRGATS